MHQHTQDTLLQAGHIVKSYGATQVLHDVSFDVARGEILCLLGPSGCGKSTLLNIIAGLEHADSGSVIVNGEDISGTPVHRRGFGLMFQGLALFPHRNVADNVAFGLRMAHKVPATIHQRVAEVLDLVGLTGFGKRDVNQLSGGEQQRVALARSLAPRPKLLMLDEPLSSLDRALRERLMDELRVILTHVGQTAIYVTHDQQEAFALSDRMVILNAGRVAQCGAPRDLYQYPADAFVARFLGQTNLIEGTVSANDRHLVHTAIGPLALEGESCNEGNVTVLVRPDGAVIDGATNHITGTLCEQTFRGRYTRITVMTGSTHLIFELDSTESLPLPGSTLTLSIRPDSITCLPQATA
jgi:ABC-type Fe3+/spermidine/putrescine transport system ATPase subunit